MNTPHENDFQGSAWVEFQYGPDGQRYLAINLPEELAPNGMAPEEFERQLQAALDILAPEEALELRRSIQIAILDHFDERDRADRN